MARLEILVAKWKKLVANYFMTGVAEKKEVFATVFLCLLSHVNQFMHILVETKKYSQES